MRRGNVSVVRRERGSPIDTLVSEMMILANSTWAQILHDNDLPGLFRVQPAGKVRMSTKSEPHIGMGVQRTAGSPRRCAVPPTTSTKTTPQPDRRHRRTAFSSKAMPNSSPPCAISTLPTPPMPISNGRWKPTGASCTCNSKAQRADRHHPKEDLVRIEGLPLVTRATGIPFDALPKSAEVLLKITELDPEKQFIALNYVKAVAPAVA